MIDLASPVAAEEGCELLDAELVFEAGRKILRLYLDKPGGVAIGDCARVSHAVEDLLEVEDAVSGPYNLEVSSPGSNRPLRTRAHFEQVLGETVQIVTHEKIGGRRRYEGILMSLRERDVLVQIDNGVFKVPLDKIAKAHVVK